MSWPTTNDPRTEFVTVRFTASEAADIAWLIQRTNKKDRSSAVRECVDRVIAAERKRERKERKHAETGIEQRSLDDAPEE